MKNPVSPMLMRLVASMPLVILIGCGRGEVKTYRVAKEQSSAMQMDQMPPGHPPAATQPRLTWKSPEGWTEGAPSEFRLASFNIKGDGGKEASMSIIPLPGQAGGDLANVNRWRVDQLGLQPVSADELAKLAQSVEVAGQSADLYDVAGKNTGSGDPTRILGVIQHRGGTAWFFKMTGDDELVARQKMAFVDFLKSVKFNSGEMAALPAGHPPMDVATLPAGHPPVETPALPDGHPPVGGGNLPAGHPEISSAPATAASSPASDGKPRWTVPSGWKEVPGGQFLVAKFTIAEGAAQAAVNVSMSAGDGGGLLANVNRWRGQLGQSPWGDAELQKQTREIEVAGGKATLVEMSGTDARTGQPSQVVGAIVPQAGQTWFYKLMGDAKIVEAQKAAFVKFLETVKY